LQGRYVTADKGYDSGSFVEWLKKRGAIVVIPSRRTAKHPRSIDRHIYLERYWVGNLFLELKVHRRFSTRYEKWTASFFAVSLLTAILVWIAWVWRHPL